MSNNVFPDERQAPSQLTSSQHAALGLAAALSIEAASWSATERNGHGLETRTLSLDGQTRQTIQYHARPKQQLD